MTIQVEYQSYINSIYQLSDDGDYLVLSNDPNEDELEILYQFLNNIKYSFEKSIRSPILINMWAEDHNINYNAAEIEIREYYNKRIETVLADRSVIDEWCKENDLPIPGSQESSDRKKQHRLTSDIIIKRQDKKRAKKEKQKYPHLSVAAANDLLENLEDKNYVPTKIDERNMNHPSFKTHRANRTKNKLAYFDIIAKKILKVKVISINEFCNICKCPNSDYYKKYYMRSFLDFCVKEGGEYKNITNGERYINETSEKEITLRIKK